MISDVRFVIDAFVAVSVLMVAVPLTPRVVFDIVPNVDVPVMLSVVPFRIVIVAFGLEILTEFAID